MVLIASYLGWRWSIAGVALAILLTALAMLVLVPRPARRRNPTAGGEGSWSQVFSNPRVVALLGSVALERVCYATVVIFFATYLRLTYDPSPELLFWALALTALGNVFGNQLGGRLSDRLQTKYHLVAGAMASSSLLAFPLLLGAPGLPISIGLGLVYNLCNAMSRPSLWWMLSDVSREARGTVMGVNITIAGVGWLIASALGGWLVVGTRLRCPGGAHRVRRSRLRRLCRGGGAGWLDRRRACAGRRTLHRLVTSWSPC